MHSQYETLSYSWHNNEWNDFTTEQKKLYEPWEIICNGKNVTVQPNLWRALQRLRHRDRSRTVWADALCIDQSNDRERAQQVQIMSLIYSNALQTVIWMGESKQASVEKSLDLICRIVNSWDERHPAEYWMTDDATSETLARRPTGPVAKEDDENFALSDLFRLSWFRRKWVIQEAVLSRSCEIIWQNCSISWYWVGLAAAIIRNQNIENLFISEPSNTGICNAYLIFRLSSHEGLPSVQLTFLQLLRLTATFQATDPRDSIFALLGIQTKDHHPQNSPLFLADYTLDTETLFRKVAEKFMDHPEPLKFLVNTESWTKTGATRNKEYITDSKPSWVPIWGKNAGFMLAPWSLQDGFHPARGLDFQRQITEDTSHLVVRGIGITTVLCREDENLRDSVWDLLTCGMFKVVSLEILELFSRTLTCGRNAYGGREREVHALLSHFAAFLCANKDTSIDKIETSKANEHLDISVLNALAKDGDAKAFEAVASNVCQNSRLFLTVSGHIGLGPRQIGSGDVICVLGGADMPFALRRQDGCYTLVGDCYIDDVMEGQAVEAMKMKCSHHGAFDIEKVIDSRLASEWIPEQVRPQVELVRDDLVAAAAKKYSVLQESWIEIC
ncbi:hypothetical protein GLAREA_03455 [Glarea lozoyensis ATCC 20868]|uniref:Heterokaryon incompatibility domain-containing protein n=1 Tax=Glarea lozoyensis (strain ATCC 20868 / MF5171) TaxID=1116229 RepID=S3DVS1_GLAL2|nr:uncharacterized protein GLAREA_03455 [Glarea lozoyensis ATCC 20868]EPE30488.1 hypothetical protein GLAREA_03455 [Glarea lozoyensis ATCC 20868]